MEYAVGERLAFLAADVVGVGVAEELRAEVAGEEVLDEVDVVSGVLSEDLVVVDGDDVGVLAVDLGLERVHLGDVELVEVL